MAINVSKIKNLPTHLQVIIAVIPTIIIVALFIFLIYSPKNKQIQGLNTRIAQLDKEIAVGEEKVRSLDALIAENARLKEKLVRLKEQLPEEKEVSELLKQISELGLQSGLEILLWKPESRRTDPQGLYVEIPVKVNVLAEYHKLGDFYSHISRLPRLVNISDINLKTKTVKGQEAPGIIDAEFTARTFASAGPGNAGEVKGKGK
ncbi:MAG: type 4a pilus biogenesis protein PilO [Nitrospiraceae bacterium]|nr:MAG: type 4a pilus biogenesis protein PilO [Nitrospiraceae bacterium]